MVVRNETKKIQRILLLAQSPWLWQSTIKWEGNHLQSSNFIDFYDARGQLVLDLNYWRWTTFAMLVALLVRFYFFSASVLHSRVMKAKKKKVFGFRKIAKNANNCAYIKSNAIKGIIYAHANQYCWWIEEVAADGQRLNGESSFKLSSVHLPINHHRSIH